MSRRLLLSLVCVLSLSASLSVAQAQTPLTLIRPDQKQGGWQFDNGKEFPGAVGKLEVAEEKHREQAVLKLTGDFTKGGNYVQAAIHLPNVAIDTFSFWVHLPAGNDSLTVRLVDGTSQCHQLKLKINDKGGWQQISLPVERYFKTMGTPAALDLARQYEKWGGSNDGKWHQPGKLFVVLLGKGDQAGQRELLLSDVSLKPAPPQTEIQQTISLSEALAAGEIDFNLNLGPEFKGAKGGVELAKDQPEAGQNAMRLHADFTEGGAYVGLQKPLSELDVQKIKAIRLKLRSEKASKFNVLLVDGRGQTHQRKGISLTADGKWHDVDVIPSQIAGGEHWGGPNDGKWYEPAKFFQLSLNTGSAEDKRPELFIADVRADVVRTAQAVAASFAEDFEAAERFQGWKTAGTAALAAGGTKDAGQSLALTRTLETIDTKTSATGPAFTVTPGAWQVGFAWRGDLHSPDNSYHGSVALEALNAAGAVVETIPVDIGFGKTDWKTVSKQVTLPAQAAQARFRVSLEKTYGEFKVDDLSAARLSVQPIQQRVERIMIASKAVGNLFLPDEPAAFQVTVHASSPLPTADQKLRYAVRDYWGAEQAPLGEVPLAAQPRKDGKFLYTAEVTLPAKPLEVGKYFELHAFVPQGAADPVGEFAGFAVLPLAPAKQHKAEEIPFTIRNWDNRVPAYFALSDRLGLRLIGLWGGWDEKAPYKAHLPGVDEIQKLGARWLTTTPAASVERVGFKEYSEESLKLGMKNFLTAYADKGLYMIALGNEPHGTGQKVLDNVKAYKALYETVKEFNPQLQVLGTSVEPNEEYFKAGYQNWLDAYDFHIYEHYTHVRRTMREYRELMEKYKAVKPIHSTELGLNSQGQTRLSVAREMIKKTAVFFAEGGTTISWFTIQYPDPQGKARGQFGDSHCVFDCKYSLYNPRLDAVTYYTLINGIANKKFVAEKHYENGAQAYLFRDGGGNSLQMLWSDDVRQDVLAPLPAGREVELVRIDGSRQKLKSVTDGITLTLSADPVLLFYSDANATLAGALGHPTMALEAPPKADGASLQFAVTGRAIRQQPSSVRVLAPAGWEPSAGEGEKERAGFTFKAPSTTAARTARMYVQQVVGDDVVGEVTVEADWPASR